MRENKYWWIIVILEMIFFLMLLNFITELKSHGYTFLGNAMGAAVFLYLFYSLGKAINDLMK